MRELRPCPVCTGKLRLRHECSGDGYTSYWAECVSMLDKERYCHYKTGAYTSKHAVLRIVNTRPAEEALRTENEAQAKEIEELKAKVAELEQKLSTDTRPHTECWDKAFCNHRELYAENTLMREALNEIWRISARYDSGDMADVAVIVDDVLQGGDA